MNREDRRQYVHFSITFFALTLIWLPLWAGWIACGAAILVEWVLLPVLGRHMGLERDGERYLNGLKTYPLAVLVVLVAFPLPAAVAAWGVMGVGDAASNLVGRPYGRQGFAGRSDRSLLGTTAFVVTAWPAAWALATYVGHVPGASAVLPALAAAVSGAIAELLPLQKWLDDNLPIAVAAGAAFYVCNLAG